jgi:bis(5'-nucleosidyl)-tetraphosphatase
MRLIDERSAGVVPFLRERGSSRLYYLVIHSARVRHPRARWEFPKGHIETGETPRQAAAREFVEETGLRAWRFRDGFERSVTYTYARDGLARHKKVVYFLAEVFDPSAMARSLEHSEDRDGRWYRWICRNEAHAVLSHLKSRALFGAADTWLRASLRLDDARCGRRPNRVG